MTGLLVASSYNPNTKDHPDSYLAITICPAIGAVIGGCYRLVRRIFIYLCIQSLVPSKHKSAVRVCLKDCFGADIIYRKSG